MSDRPLIYVCSPFRGDTQGNAERARGYCRKITEAGYTPLAPHLYFPQFLNDGDPQEREAAMGMGMALLPYCRALVVCGDSITEGMKREVLRAKELGVEVCSLENIPPIPTLDNYKDDLTGLENLGIAMSLIESMTDSRFACFYGSPYISHPGEGAYLGMGMEISSRHEDGSLEVRFNAYLRTMGAPLDAMEAAKLRQEAARVGELLSLLESRRYILTPEEFREFCDSIRQRENVSRERENGKDALPDNNIKDTGKPSVLRQIIEARKQPGKNGKTGHGKPNKGRDAEL
jgi:hypothetical protein